MSHVTLSPTQTITPAHPHPHPDIFCHPHAHLSPQTNLPTAIALDSEGGDIVGSILFVLALTFKQMALYYALPFFFYILGKAWRRPQPCEIGLGVFGPGFALNRAR